MSKEGYKQTPAFPVPEEQMDRADQYPEMKNMTGMSKRFYAACAAMQGILSNNDIRMDLLMDSKQKSLNEKGLQPSEYFAVYAYEIADALLKQEQNEPK